MDIFCITATLGKLYIRDEELLFLVMIDVLISLLIYTVDSLLCFYWFKNSKILIYSDHFNIQYKFRWLIND